MEPQIYQDFPEVKGKTVERVELSVESGYYGITVRFTDKTALAFEMDTCLVTSTVYADWTGGEEKIVKAYETVRSEVSPETEARLKES